MMRRAAIAAAAACLCAASCAWGGPRAVSPFAGPGLYAVDGAQMLRQYVTVEAEGERQSFTAMAEASADKVTVLGFGAFGVRLFLLSWTDLEVTYKPNPTYEPLVDPGVIYSDMQFALVRPEDFKQLEIGGVKIEQTEDRQRIVTKDGKERLRVQYGADAAWDNKFLMVYAGRPLRVLVRSVAE